MRIGFIGLGNVGGKLASSLMRNGYSLSVLDIDDSKVDSFVKRGATRAKTPAEITRDCDVVITCLPSPKICAEVLEGEDGILSEMSGGKFWCEMSTTDESEVIRLGNKISEAGGIPVDCPVSGGCHRAATGNISIFAGCSRDAFDSVFPLLSAMGRRILHTGPLGSASVLKVITNYLASANLATLCEALVTAKLAGLDLKTAYNAILISSGNSFVHETESQVILNGSRDINFTIDLVVKDLTLFQSVADRAGASLEVSKLLLEIFEDAKKRYGPNEWSPNVIRRLEDANGISVLSEGFPDSIVDNEPEKTGYEIASR